MHVVREEVVQSTSPDDSEDMEQESCSVSSMNVELDSEAEEFNN